ncbi:hypothetical protein ACROYT_G004991 [Oculina patagonica]
MKSFLLLLMFISLVSDSLCLRCLQCYSSMSWEDCNKHAKKTGECKPPKVCFMSHRMFKRNGQQVHQFSKACYNPDWCSEEKCRKTENRVDSSWCETNCCKDKDFCNSGITRSWESAYYGNAPSVAAPFKLCVITGLLSLFMVV